VHSVRLRFNKIVNCAFVLSSQNSNTMHTLCITKQQCNYNQIQSHTCATAPLITTHTHTHTHTRTHTQIPVRGSRESSSTRSSLGPSMQAQPSSIPSSLRLKKHGSLSHSSSKSGSVVKQDSGRVGSGSGSSSSSYVCSSASSEAHISQEVSSSSGGGSAEESLNRSMSSDGLSGSSGSKGSGSQSQKGCSGSSNGGHDADESTVSSVARQTPSSLESEDLGESEVVHAVNQSHT